MFRLQGCAGIATKGESELTDSRPGWRTADEPIEQSPSTVILGVELDRECDQARPWLREISMRTRGCCIWWRRPLYAVERQGCQGGDGDENASEHVERLEGAVFEPQFDERGELRDHG